MSVRGITLGVDGLDSGCLQSLQAMCGAMPEARNRATRSLLGLLDQKFGALQ
jgi:hypothetical protein